MSQFGMQMPGGRARRAASLDIYAVLAFLAVIFLVVATFVMYSAASKVGKGGNAFGIQEPATIDLSHLNTTP